MNTIRMLEIGEPVVEDSKFALILASKCPDCGAPIWVERPEKQFNEVPKNLFSCECRLVVKVKNPVLNDYWFRPYSPIHITSPFVPSETLSTQPWTMTSGTSQPSPLNSLKGMDFSNSKNMTEYIIDNDIF